MRDVEPKFKLEDIRVGDEVAYTNQTDGKVTWGTVTRVDPNAEAEPKIHGNFAPNNSPGFLWLRNVSDHRSGGICAECEGVPAIGDYLCATCRAS